MPQCVNCIHNETCQSLEAAGCNQYSYKEEIRHSRADWMLRKVASYLKAYSFRISKRGVPYLLTWMNGICYSICYFGRSRSFRVFYPFGVSQQVKIDLKLYTDVAKYFGR